ncbi:MAG: hypothetical protein F4Y20_07315 [Acidobacteria bacterium]|nr:hypothetical protein [Gemmatimonadota bacterium]MYB32317.1 hypothetical protein [Acidobacteriota bacterium]MYH23529.1 hypothetical protein [Acidobacteriota bacterium]MYJ10509.1 hypothetical protein [Gemmatimonadota bacterium]MYK80796.1 hypothetical protein [Acidobacteriota bacterium]
MTSKEWVVAALTSVVLLPVSDGWAQESQEGANDPLAKRMAVVLDDHLFSVKWLGVYLPEDEALAYGDAVRRAETAKRSLHDEVPAHFEVLNLAVNVVASLAPERWQDLQRAIAEIHVLEANFAGRFPDDVNPDEIFARYRSTADSLTWEILSLKRYATEEPE